MTDFTNNIQHPWKKFWRKAMQRNQNQDGRVWCLPHHGVYYPRKLDKIRADFDCSSNLNGRSISKELLMGPDLTNQTIGVLTRF